MTPLSARPGRSSHDENHHHDELTAESWKLTAFS